MKGDELDRILDDALSSYSLREPRAGFNARAMVRVRAEEPALAWNWLRLATAALALTTLAATVTMWQRQKPAPVPKQARIERQAPVVPAVLTPAKPSPRRERPIPEQLAWLKFAQDAPEAARQLAVPDKPLSIEEINIPPLQIAGVEIGEIE